MQQQGLKPNVSIYTSLLRIYCTKKEMFPVALTFFQNMTENDISISQQCLDLMILASVSANDFDKATYFYNEMLKKGYVPKETTYSQLLIMFMKRNRSEGEAFFEKLKSSNTSMLSYCSVMLNEYSRTGENDKMDQIWNYMKEANIQPDILIFHSLMRQKVKSNDITGVYTIIEQMKSYSVSPDGRFFNSLLFDLCNQELYEEAINFFKKLLVQDKVPFQIYETLIKSFSKIGRKDDLFFIFDTAIKNRIRLSVTEYNAVMQEAEDCQDTQALNHYWDLLKSNRKIDPNADSYSIILESGIKSQNFLACESILKSMAESNLEPTSEQFLSLINLAVNFRLFSKAINLFELCRNSSTGKHLQLNEAISRNLSSFDNMIVERAKALEEDNSSDLSNSENKNLKTVLLIYKEIINSGSTPSEAAFQAVMKIHFRENDLIGVVHVWQTLLKHYKNPLPATIQILLKSAFELGEITTAKAILSNIKNSKYALDQVGYEFLILMTCKWNPEEVKYLIIDMINDGFPLLPSFYAKMMSVLSDAKYDHPDRHKLLEFIEEQLPEFASTEGSDLELISSSLFELDK